MSYYDYMRGQSDQKALDALRPEKVVEVEVRNYQEEARLRDEMLVIALALKKQRAQTNKWRMAAHDFESQLAGAFEIIRSLVQEVETCPSRVNHHPFGTNRAARMRVHDLRYAQQAKALNFPENEWNSDIKERIEAIRAESTEI